jgi:hypothetical protein
MIHFLPLAAESEPVREDGELLSRLAGLKRALRLVDPFGGGPAPDFDGEFEAAAFACAGEPVRRCLDRRSERLVGAAAAGLEAVVSERSFGHEPNRSSIEILAQEIRDGLADLSSLFRH